VRKYLYMSEEIARKHTSLTHDSEKKLLDFLAKVIYKFLSADSLSIIGLLGLIFSGLCLVLAGKNIFFLLLSPLGLFINWFGDSLDGRVARLRNAYRPKAGYYIDKFIDTLGIISIALGVEFSLLTLKPYWMYALILALLIMVHVFLRAGISKVMELNLGIFGPTELRIISITFLFILYLSKNPVYFNKFIGYYTLLDFAGAIFCIALAIALGISVYKTLWGKYRIKE